MRQDNSRPGRGRGKRMYNSNKHWEEIRKQGQEQWEKMKEERQDKKYVTRKGTPIVCVICKHNSFQKGTALLNTRGMTFFGLDWLNEGAVTLICSQCGYIHWFAEDVKET